MKKENKKQKKEEDVNDEMFMVYEEKPCDVVVDLTIIETKKAMTKDKVTYILYNKNVDQIKEATKSLMRYC